MTVELDLEALIRSARIRLPSSHRALLEQIGVQDALVYGHALSVTRASAEDKRDGPRLVELLPPGLRCAVDYPGGYRPRQVFDEVVANVYALMISRLVHHDDYVVPDFLHVDLYDAFRAVVPWPPDHR